MSVRVIETVVSQTLLGLRFWDRLREAPVADGLLVRAQRLSADRARRVGRAVTARPTRSGVYACFGLSPHERATEDTWLWEQVPPARRAVIEVSDAFERYLPVMFEVALPQRGPFRGTGAWLSRPLMLPAPAAEGPQGIQLWPSPTYTVPAGYARITGQLVVGDAARPAPLAHAVVRVQRRAGGGFVDHGFGLSGADGQFVVPLRYPPIPDPPVVTDPYPPLHEQRFDLRIQVLRTTGELPTLPESSLPNLEAILGQDQAQIALRRNNDATLDLADQLDTQLQYGLALVVRTATEDPERPEPWLRIVPAGP